VYAFTVIACKWHFGYRLKDADAFREELWRKLGGEWAPRHLSRIASRVVTLEEVPAACAELIAGTVTGRILVKISG